MGKSTVPERKGLRNMVILRKALSVIRVLRNITIPISKARKEAFKLKSIAADNKYGY